MAQKGKWEGLHILFEFATIFEVEVGYDAETCFDGSVELVGILSQASLFLD